MHLPRKTKEGTKSTVNEYSLKYFFMFCLTAFLTIVIGYYVINELGLIVEIIRDLTQNSKVVNAFVEIVKGINKHPTAKQVACIVIVVLIGVCTGNMVAKYLKRWVKAWGTLHRRIIYFLHIREGIFSAFLCLGGYVYFFHQNYAKWLFSNLKILLVVIYSVIVISYYIVLLKKEKKKKRKIKNHLFSELPIENKDEDLLNRNSIVLQLIREVKRCFNDFDKSGNIALCGKRGLGKTSVLNLFKNNYKGEEYKKEYRIVEITPVEYLNDRKTLAKIFFQKITELLKEEYPVPWIEYITMEYVYSYLGAKLPFFHKLIESIVHCNEDRFKEEFERVLQLLKIKIIVIVDDLDRCPPSTVHLFSRMLLQIGRLENVVYIIAIDDDDYEKKMKMPELRELL